MPIVDIIVYIIVSIIITLLIVSNIVLGLKRRNLIATVAQLTLDRELLIKKLEKSIEKENQQELEGSDGFVRFISESRDWAFSYIDSVQSAITDLALSRNDNIKLELAINKLIDLLPEEK